MIGAPGGAEQICKSRRTGILPITLPGDHVASLMALASDAASAQVVVGLDQQSPWLRTACGYRRQTFAAITRKHSRLDRSPDLVAGDTAQLTMMPSIAGHMSYDLGS